MKKYLIGGVVMMGLTIGAQAFAFAPYVDGHRTIATPNAVVIGGQVFEVKDDPKTVEEMQLKVTQLEAQVYDAQISSTGLKASTCTK